MTSGLAFVQPDTPLYRLGRGPDPWAWPGWSYTGPDGTFGNRYDDPDASYRVLYASSQRMGGFVETLARFRPDLELLAELQRIDGDDEPAAGVPRTWLNGRRIGTATLEGRFVDVGGTRSLATLRVALAASAIHHGLDEIDASTIRLSVPRAFTQRVSRFVYEQRDDLGSFAGIRYRSRLGDELVNWAVFEPAPGVLRARSFPPRPIQSTRTTSIWPLPSRCSTSHSSESNRHAAGSARSHSQTAARLRSSGRSTFRPASHCKILSGPGQGSRAEPLASSEPDRAPGVSQANPSDFGRVAGVAVAGVTGRPLETVRKRAVPPACVIPDAGPNDGSSGSWLVRH